MNVYTAYVGIEPQSQLQSLSSDYITVPLGQLVLASTLARRFNEMKSKICVFSMRLTKEDRILKYIESLLKNGERPLVGITLNAGSADKALTIAQAMYKMGIDVLLGGPEVSLEYRLFGIRLIDRRPFIRGFVDGAGEHVIPHIIEKGFSEDVPNLVYRDIDDKRIHRGPQDLSSRLLDFADVQVDYSLLVDIANSNGVSYLWKTDCHLADRRRCYFCGRMQLGSGTRDPKRVWDELVQAKIQWGINYFYNVADSIGTSATSLRDFVQKRPNKMRDVIHRCFINAHQVKRTVALLKELKAIVAVGIESFALFDTVGKGGDSVASNEEALQLLAINHIPTIISFVLGLPGESKETLSETHNYILRLIKDYPYIVGVEVSPLTVTCGSQAYNDVRNKRMDKYDALQPPFNVVDMSNDYFEIKTHVSRLQAVEFCKKLLDTLVVQHPLLGFDIKGLSQKEAEIFNEFKPGQPNGLYTNHEGFINYLSQNGSKPWS